VTDRFYWRSALFCFVVNALFGAWPDWLRAVWPPFLPTSPAWLILIGPLLMMCWRTLGDLDGAWHAVSLPPGIVASSVPAQDRTGPVWSAALLVLLGAVGAGGRTRCHPTVRRPASPQPWTSRARLCRPVGERC
jgi:hypothetical protein